MSASLAALLLGEEPEEGEDMRKAAKREKARRVREALKGDDDDALADALFPEDEADDDELEG